MSAAKTPKPLAVFRVYPEPKSSLYCRTYIWRNLRDFRAANPGNSHALGLCREFLHVTVRDGQPNRVLPDFAEVHLSKRHLRIGIITHEYTHAVLAWATRTRCVPDFIPIQKWDGAGGGTLKQDSNEERFCHAMGDMVRKCIYELYRRKILK